MNKLAIAIVFATSATLSLPAVAEGAGTAESVELKTDADVQAQTGARGQGAMSSGGEAAGLSGKNLPADDVRAVQQALRDAGADIAADGVWSDSTTQALNAYQRAEGLPPVWRAGCGHHRQTGRDPEGQRHTTGRESGGEGRTRRDRRGAGGVLTRLPPPGAGNVPNGESAADNADCASKGSAFARRPFFQGDFGPGGVWARAPRHNAGRGVHHSDFRNPSPSRS